MLIVLAILTIIILPIVCLARLSNLNTKLKKQNYEFWELWDYIKKLEQKISDIEKAQTKITTAQQEGEKFIPEIKPQPQPKISEQPKEIIYPTKEQISIQAKVPSIQPEIVQQNEGVKQIPVPPQIQRFKVKYYEPVEEKKYEESVQTAKQEIQVEKKSRFKLPKDFELFVGLSWMSISGIFAFLFGIIMP